MSQRLRNALSSEDMLERTIQKVFKAFPALPLDITGPAKSDMIAIREMQQAVLREMLTDTDSVLSIHSNMQARKKEKDEEAKVDQSLLPKTMKSVGKIPDYVRADLITGSSDMNSDDLKEALTHDNQADQQLIQFNTAWGAGYKLDSKYREQTVLQAGYNYRAGILGNRLGAFKANGGIKNGTIHW